MKTRDLVKNFINAKHREEIIFTKGATESINLVATTYGEEFINEEMRSYLQARTSFKLCSALLRNKKKAVIKFASINENLEIEADEINKLITNKTENYSFNSYIKCYRRYKSVKKDNRYC